MINSWVGDEDQLSDLAYEWRGSNDQKLIAAYQKKLRAMMKDGYTDVLDAESELPDEYMPRAYLLMHRPSVLKAEKDKQRPMTMQYFTKQAVLSTRKQIQSRTPTTRASTRVIVIAPTSNTRPSKRRSTHASSQLEDRKLK